MQELEELRKLLETKSKHGNYQMLPPALLDLDPALSSYSHSRRLDSQRYDWFSEKLNFENKSILDIGANVGYFSFRLATEKNAKITTYEPFNEHSIAIDRCKRILGIGDEKFRNVNLGVSLADLDNLEKFDVVLFFNVIQHAGEDFDRDAVQSIDEWRDYALQYLSKLRSTADCLIFQTGYTWLGHNGKLCDEIDTLDFTINLLHDAGWNIKYCGVVENYNCHKYVDYNVSQGSKNPHPVVGRRTKLAVRFKNKFLNRNLDYRFMQRPIFICE